jgi:hypothetical protein
MAYAVVYAFSTRLSFQYFAWSVPFWFFLRPWWCAAASVLAGGYIYTVYWLLCSNPWLLGQWDFVGHPDWPDGLQLLRDLTLLFFLASAGFFFVSFALKRTPGWLAIPEEGAAAAGQGGS